MKKQSNVSSCSCGKAGKNFTRYSVGWVLPATMSQGDSNESSLLFGGRTAWIFPRESDRNGTVFILLLFGEAMHALGKDFVFLTQYIRNLRGGSQPILAQASDGFLYVVKFSNNLQGPNLLFNESAGSELYRACGLSVPAWRPLQVSEDFLDGNPDCWMQTEEGRLRPASGLCFGSRFLGGNGRQILEILPGSSFNRVRNRTSFCLAWLIDICARHVDNRQAIFVEDAEGWLDAHFVDHGHLFGGPKGGHQMHFLASRYLDSRIYQSVSSQYLLSLRKLAVSLDASQLWRRVQDLPDDWKTSSAVEGFAQCLSRLSTPRLVQGVLDTIATSFPRMNEREDSWHQDRRKPQVSVLWPRIQAAGFEPSFVANRAGRSNCA